VASCALCRDEVRALRAFVGRREPRRSWRELTARVGRIVWHPAFAYAVVLIALTPLLASRFSRDAGVPSPAEVEQDVAAPPTAGEREYRRVAKDAEEAPRAKRVAPAGTGAGAASRADEPTRLAQDRATDAAAPPPAAAKPETAGPVAVSAMPGSVRLDVAVPADRDVDVVVRSADGRRVLRETVWSATGRAAVMVPTAWLQPGRWTVQVGDGGPQVVDVPR
jgi:hypothetical protein